MKAIFDKFLTDEETDKMQNSVEAFAANSTNAPQILERLFPTATGTGTVRLSKNVYKDIELGAMFPHIDRTATAYGKHFLMKRLREPCESIYELRARQAEIKAFGNGQRLLFHELEGTAECVLKFFEGDDSLAPLYDTLYFRFPLVAIVNEQCNSNPHIMNLTTLYRLVVYPLTTTLSPIVTYIIPYLWARYKGIEVPLGTIFRLVMQFTGTRFKVLGVVSLLIWTLLYFQNVYFSVVGALTIIKVVRIIYKKMRAVYKTVAFAHANAKANGVGGDLHELFSKYTFLENDEGLMVYPQMCSVLSLYHEFMKRKEQLVPVIEFIGKMDATQSIATLVNSEGSGSGSGWCYPTFGVAEVEGKGKRQFRARNLWYPLFGPGAKRNSIRMGPNILITGPNRAGKSSFVKSIVAAIVFAQTLGIAPARRLRLSPFASISTFFESEGQLGRSSFESELVRNKEYLDSLDAESDANHFVALDELFSTTNYNEGFSVAYAMAYILAGYKNSLSCITTHYTHMSELEQRTNGALRNMHFDVSIDLNGRIQFPYKLRRGVSHKYIALKLLKESNFDHKLLEIAQAKCAELVAGDLARPTRDSK